ncbi:RHS repeat-associated core domain-containing protein [Catenulispora sp. NL8]|uniref:RHS repeat-associated core domain-containing protein n=1 Tax=Catenulispora pinistramenti TaxID=2705254 RepID=A0ABS5KGV0_9ACTN|nr:RHS repeat-associated core domain-containing protein [Catenulispora pinistramenti]MBS2545308.1 RHS repeat-associated core domain-containing protein [Catenulispora pinistramenti]
MHIQIADHASALNAGVNGVLFSATATSGGGKARVALDYSSFAAAFGGDYSDRLRLIQLPACALTTPGVPACRVQSPLGSVVDSATKTVGADVDLPASPAVGTAKTATTEAAAGATTAQAAVVMAATAAPAGSSGTYTATSLKASGAWSAGGSAGSFDYSYPINVPPALGGQAPKLALSYDSGSVDGQTAATNGQASWIGDGWSYDAGYIERSYKPCSKDGVTGSADLCWPGGDTTLSFSLGGHSGDIVRDDATGALKMSGDDGSTITKISNAANGTANGEAFLVTTADGTKYYFGLGHLPGGNNTDAATNSVYTEPVYAPNSGDPCHTASDGQGSWCQMGWRFNLDAIVDPRGNLTQFTYTPEANYYNRGYGQNNGNGTATSYVRGGVLNTISYGWSTVDALAGVKPAAQIVFGSTERCVKDVTTCQFSNLSSSTASNWPDVPYDQNCTSSGNCTNYSPTYWSTKMLSTITTQVLVGSAYQQVDLYTLNHQFPDPGDGTAPSLWLASIGHRGLDGGSLDAPNVVFYGTLLANRVPGLTVGGQGLPPMNHWRLQTVADETGSTITANYAATTSSIGSCSQSATGGLPKPDANGVLCFPQYWTPTGQTTPILDWFFKYVATRVSNADDFGQSPTRTVSYTYLGPAAWHSNDSELTDPARRTWDEWRGFGQVITESGTAPDPITKTQTTYLRGMDQDANAAGQDPAVTVSDSQGAVYTDDNALAGFTLETQVFTGAGGAVDSDKISVPSLTTTATHTRISPLPKQRARLQAVVKTLSRDLLSNGTWRTAEVDSTYDPDHGNRLTETDDKGDGTSATPELCTDVFYASSAANPQMLDYTAETRTIAAPCGTAPTSANTVSDAVTLYDNNTSVLDPALDNSGQALGEATGTMVLNSYTTDNPPVPQYVLTGTTAYDSYGRTVSITDPNATDAAHPSGATTTTTYNPATGSLPAVTIVTNPMGWATMTTLDPGRQQPTQVVDINGAVTNVAYDPLGRTTAQWSATHTQAANPTTPNQKFIYSLGGSATSSWVQTQTLREDGSYGNSYQLLDGFGEVRQTQSDSPDGSGGRLIADTMYDSHGWTVKTSSPYYNSTAPSSALFAGADNAIAGQTVTAFDGQGRATSSTFFSYANPQWTTTTAYPGVERTDVTPPTPSAPTSTFTDARGRTVSTWRYKTPTATGNAADADVINSTYTPGGLKATVTDATGKNTTAYTYDLRGRQIQLQDPDTGVSTQAYNADSKLAATTDGRGQALSYSYDLLGRKTGEYTGTSITDPTQLQASWSYDTVAKGQPTGSTRYVGGQAGAQYTSAVTGYTADYKPTRSTITIPSVEGSLAGSYTTNLYYTPTTELPLATKFPAAADLAAEQVTTAFTEQGQPLRISGASDYLSNVQYDVHGNPLRVTMGDMPLQTVQTMTYDPATNRPLSDTVDKENGSTSVDVTSYTYDLAGRITSTKDLEDGTTTDLQCYGYDYAGRISTAWTDTGSTTTAASPTVAGIGGCANPAPTAATAKNQIGGPAPYWQSYTYKVTGDRDTEVDHDITGNATNDATRTYGYLPSGTVNTGTDNGGTGAGPDSSTSTTLSGKTNGTDTFSYDAAGNTTTRHLATGANQSLSWDAEGHLSQVKNVATGKQQASYLYDASGALLIQRDATETVLYLDGQEIHLPVGGTATGVRHITAPGGVTVAETANTFAYQFADPQNTAELSIDAVTLSVTRRFYDIYGRARGATPGSWPDENGFLDKPADGSTGLDLLGARNYDPTAGRFVSVDPVLEDSDPNQMGGYTYAGDNPVNHSDPTGLMIPTDDGSFGNMTSYEAATSGTTSSCTTFGVDGCEGPVVPNGTGGSSGGSTSGSTSSTSNFTYPLTPCVSDPPKHKSWWDTALQWGSAAVAGAAVAAAFSECEGITLGIATPGCVAAGGGSARRHRLRHRHHLRPRWREL